MVISVGLSSKVDALTSVGSPEVSGIIANSDVNKSATHVLPGGSLWGFSADTLSEVDVIVLIDSCNAVVHADIDLN